MTKSTEHTSSGSPGPAEAPMPALSAEHGGALMNAVVRAFLNSNLSLILILLAGLAGLASLLVTPREEDPQIVVPLADVFVQFPGHSAAEVEQLVTTPLEQLLYQIDGVEYVYSMSRPDSAVITVRYYVGEDRERSLVKLYKKIDENVDVVPPGVTGWVVKPVEIDDVPIVTLTLTSATSDEFVLRRVGEELVERLAAVDGLSRAYVVGGQPRVVYVHLDPDRLQAHGLAPRAVRQAIAAADVTLTAGDYARDDTMVRVTVGEAFGRPDELNELVVGLSGDRPVLLKDVATVEDGPAEAESYVRHGWGPARGVGAEHDGPGVVLGQHAAAEGESAAATAAAGEAPLSQPAVTIALAKKRGTNAVWVAQRIMTAAAELAREVVPSDVEVVVTRNAGLTANEKVNELVEALAVAVFIVIGLLTLGLGWRESLIVAVAVPVVFGLTLTVNLVAGYTINRVTLFALILSLGLLVDDPIVDVENIARHFALRRRATRAIVLEAVAEIRPPLITATLAVIVSFLPMFFITGMMGPYMRPMALNLPVTMVMSMLVAFTITPWLSYHLLKHRYAAGGPGASTAGAHANEADAIGEVKGTTLYRLFVPLMGPLLRSRGLAWGFLGLMALLMVGAGGLAAWRQVPLKMLPFDNKNELLLVLDFDEGTTLERSDAGVRALEQHLAAVPEVTGFTSYVGLSSPMDFNGLVRHYYLRHGPNVADIRVNLAPKQNRSLQSHGLGLRERDALTELAAAHGAKLQIVEMPPGPPVIATLVAEVYGQPGHRYDELIAAARTVGRRMAREPGVVEVDDTVEADWDELVFVTDKEKAALHGITVSQIAETVQLALGGATAGLMHDERERHPLAIVLRLPRPMRSSPVALAQLHVQGQAGHLVPLAELGRWSTRTVEPTIYHKNLQRVVYVFAEVAGRPPADCVVDLLADQVPGSEASATPAGAEPVGAGWVATNDPPPVAGRTLLQPAGGIAWAVPGAFRVTFAGEGEWKITLRVFRDLGLAFAAALIGIYILLVAQTRSFAIPVVVMLAIPLTVIGIMPGFWLLNLLVGGSVGGYADVVFFTATGMIGMIALSGIVTRQAIIIIDFVHLALRHGHTLYDAILASCVVRLRPILLTVSTAMLSAVPIAIDPIFSGLAWALIFGLLASTVFTLFVIPVAYWMLYANRPGHGLGAVDRDRA